MSVLGSTRRPTTVKKLVVTALQRILTPSFITVDIFTLVAPYLFALFSHNNYDCLGHQLDAMMPFMLVNIYKMYDMS